MGLRTVFCISLFVGALFVSQTQAQVSVRTDSDAGTLLTAKTVRASNSVVDIEQGVLRAKYRIDPGGASFQSARQAATSHIRAEARQFGWNGDMRDLEEVDYHVSRAATHILYRQIYDGLPVYKRFVKYNLSEAHQPTMVLSSFDTGLYSPTVEVNRDQSVSIESAYGATQEHLAGNMQVHEGELNWLRDDNSVFKIWRLVVSTTTLPGEYEVLVSAQTGEILHVFDHSFHRRHDTEAFEPGTNAEILTHGQELQVLVDGTGLVFDPDPLSSSGSAYTPPFVDNGDSDIPEVNAQRISVALQDIELSNGEYRLNGPYVSIVGGGSLSYIPPVETDPAGFQYVRSSQHFEAVNAYYHIDKSQRYIQSLGFSSIAASPVSVNPRAFGSDNSVYSPSQNLIQFGLGGVDDGEDAGVLWHEYGHALLESTASGLIATSEGQALHEGWSDYWAGSYLRSLVDSGQSLRTDWRTVFKWDSGDGQIWAGRTIESSGEYPGDTRCEDTNDSNGDGCNIYEDGIIWAATLMDIHDELDRTVTDQLVLQSHSYLSAPATFVDAAEALIQADLDLFDGVHTAVLLNHLGNRGYINESAYGPVIVHEELDAVEQLGGSVPISARISDATATVDSVVVRYGTSVIDQELILTNASDDIYEGNLPIPSSSATLYYYIEAVDLARQRSVLPAGAPQQLFSFDVGPDNEPPMIVHNPLATSSTVLWPPAVSAVVTDNLGVLNVNVDYEMRNDSGVLLESGSFALNSSGDTYQGVLPIAANSVQSGYSVSYRLEAVDGSQAGNTSFSPQSGFYTFDIVSEGQLASFDFETDSNGFSSTGDWERGSPGFGLEFAHSGTTAWGTNPSGTYATTPGVSILELPELNLSDFNEVYLVFWHWHDFEKDGDVTPIGSSENSTLWDGGNVKISQDEGGSWNTVQPVGGYTGQIANGTPNPLSGQVGFGGYSFGWRREIIQLPTGGPVRVRFEAGTDNLNTEQARFFAGWFIDDLLLTTELEPDTDAPVVGVLPPGLIPVNVAEGFSPLELEVSDDTGVARIQFKVDPSKSSIVVDDVLLEQDTVERNTYVGSFVENIEALPGDRVAFTIEVEDFDGNISVYNNNGASFIIEFRTFLSADLLLNPTPTGLWRQDGTSWIADGDGSTVNRSGLILNPVTLPTNTDVVFLELRHEFNLRSGAGGNVKVTANDGATWEILTPLTGYDGTLDVGDHPMNGEAVFSGSQAGLSDVRFDLGRFAGSRISVKLDLGAGRPLDFIESWTVASVGVQATTVDDDAIVDLVLDLSTNYPEPFSEMTHLSYTVPADGIVKISVYDLLGRRVTVPVFSEHSPGVYTVDISGNELASGMYFVVLESSGSTVTEPISVIH
ncbi:MAG: T9SS type A sorting domain-containing protein [Rhodothermales bacterium]|nr:T9SS type A sorting domain-containing protein [Rhodothermales bacterium]